MVGSAEIRDYVEAGAMVITALCSLGAFVQSMRIQKDVRRVEVATNSMKDALVLAEGKAGEARGIAAEQARQADVAERGGTT